jgi:hypothetical protein
MELQDILSGAKINERFKSADSLESKQSFCFSILHEKLLTILF